MPVGDIRSSEALFEGTLIGANTAVGRRIFSLVVVALLLGAPAGSLGATDGAVDGRDLRDTAEHPTPAVDGTVTDTTYVARLDTLTVVGRQSRRARSGTLASAGRAGGGGSATATTGETRSPAADSGDAAPDGVMIGGLIVNETFSVIGARFARAFNDKWTEPEGVKDLGYTMTLGENPAPRRGAQVFVEVEGTTLFQGYLRPNRRQIRQAARRAVRRATVYLQKYYEPREVY